MFDCQEPELLFDDDEDDDERIGPGILALNNYWNPIVKFIERHKVTEVLFIPYAKKDMDDYADRYRKRMRVLGQYIVWTV